MNFLEKISLIQFILTILLFCVVVAASFFFKITSPNTSRFTLNIDMFMAVLVLSAFSIILNSIVLYLLKKNTNAETSEKKKIYNRTIAFIVISIMLFLISGVLIYINFKGKKGLK
jgi:hypothetical protein